jgi:hypothetical protein
MSLCCLAAFYGAKDLLSSLCALPASLLAKLPMQKPTILEDVLEIDLPKAASGFLSHSVDVCKISAGHLQEASRRLVDFNTLVCNFFKMGCGKDFNWGDLCGNAPAPNKFPVNVGDRWLGLFWNENMSEKLTKFLNYLMSDEVKRSCITLPNENPIDFHVPSDGFCSLKRGQTVFLRKCYQTIWASMEEHAKAPNRCDLNGTPGLGKSVFAIYLLYQLVNLEKKSPIIYCRAGWGHFVAEYDEYLASWECTQCNREFSGLTITVAWHPFVVLDGMDPKYYVFPKIKGSIYEVSPVWFVIGSPKCHDAKTTGHSHSERSLQEWYVPLWEEKEFKDFMKGCCGMDDVGDFQGIPLQDLDELGIPVTMKRTEVFGLNPRNVLFETPTAIRNLCLALSERAMVRETFASSSVIHAGTKPSCHRLVALKPASQLRTATPVPATDFILGRVCDVLDLDSLDALRLLVQKVKNSAEISDRSVYGMLYDRLGRRTVMERPKTEFAIQELTADGKGRMGNRLKLFLHGWVSRMPARFNSTVFPQGILTRVYYQSNDNRNLRCLDGFALTEWDTFEEQNRAVRVRHAGMIGFQMTIAPDHWVAYGKEARAFFVKFVKQALAIDFATRDAECRKKEGNVTADQSQKGGESEKPWFVFVVPEITVFVRATIQSDALDDPDFRSALSQVRLFVMEVPVGAGGSAEGINHSKPDEAVVKGFVE